MTEDTFLKTMPTQNGVYSCDPELSDLLSILCRKKGELIRIEHEIWALEIELEEYHREDRQRLVGITAQRPDIDVLKHIHLKS